ncbi:MAG TPA: M3 family oligoendopeptidase [Trueperaceae bacterium]
MAQTNSLPLWQLTSIFPGLDSAEFDEALQRLGDDVLALGRSMDDKDIRARTGISVDEAIVGTFEALTERLNDIYTRFSDIQAYLTGFIATDAFNDLAAAKRSGLQGVSSKLSVMGKRYTAWLGSLDVDILLAASDVARAHEHLLRKSQVEATHLMGDEAEALESALNPVAGSAWAKLHSDLISRDTIRTTLPGKDEADYPLTELRNLQGDQDPEVRRAAYMAERELLERNLVSYGAAMNSIKGQVNEVSERRGWLSPLDEALFESAITPASLEAMQQACRESFPVFRRYMKAKARFLGKDALAWYDLLAPVTVGPQRHYDWDEAQAFVVSNFRGYSDRLADFAQKAFERGWLDVPPRKGKRNGAFCMSVPGRQESRIMLNFGGTLDDLFTIAHELGHGYHNQCKYDFGRTLLQGQTPMTLAETASIFCETIVVNDALSRAGDEEKLAILEQDLLGSNQLVIDIYSRFLFEKTVFEKRRQRELSTDELRGIMLDAQAETYGDALQQDARHPDMWAQKGHYYSTSRSFYNYPYTFGYLFGLGLYAQYQAGAKDFRERYDELLASTGMADAAVLAARFGIDIEDPAFWRASLGIAAARVEQYEQLIDRFRHA